MGNNHQGVAPRAQMLRRQPKSVQLLRVTESLGQKMTIEVNRLPGADAAKHPGDLPFELFAGQLKVPPRSEEHTSELQSRPHLVCRLLLEKKKKTKTKRNTPRQPTPA